MIQQSKRRFRLPPWVAPALLMAAVAPLVLAQAEAPPAAEGETTEAVVTTTPERSLLEWYQAGGAFIHPIALCSFLGLALIIERALSLRRSQIIPSGFLDGLKAAMRDLHNDRQAGLRYCEQHDSPIARIMASGIKKGPRGPDAVEKAIEDAGAIETLKLRRNMRFLYSLASIATLLGLLGTIAGMISAFQTAEAVGTGKFGPLAQGIYVALITTFAGLSVAVPVTVAYYFFSGRIEKFVAEMNDVANDFADEYTTIASTGVESRDGLAPLQRETIASPPSTPGAFSPAGATI